MDTAQTTQNAQGIEPRAVISDTNVWCRYDEARDITECIENPRRQQARGGCMHLDKTRRLQRVGNIVQSRLLV